MVSAPQRHRAPSRNPEQTSQIGTRADLEKIVASLATPYVPTG
jgi:hypothetical protein